MPDRHTHPPPTATLSSKTVHNRTRNRRHDMTQRHSEPDGRVKPRIYNTPARRARTAHVHCESRIRPPPRSPPPRLASGPVPALALGAAPVVWWSVLADTRLFLPWCPCRDVRWWFCEAGVRTGRKLEAQHSREKRQETAMHISTWQWNMMTCWPFSRPICCYLSSVERAEFIGIPPKP